MSHADIRGAAASCSVGLLRSRICAAAVAALAVSPFAAPSALAATAPPHASSASLPAAPASGARATSSATAAATPDGAFIRRGTRVFRVVGGALVYVPSWAPYGGPRPIVPETGSFEGWVRTGTFIRTLQDGRVYRIVHGAPVYVSTWAPFGGPEPAIDIDVANLVNAAHEFSEPLERPWDSIARYPTDYTYQVYVDGPRSYPNTFLRSAQNGRVYVSVAGTPIYLSSWDAFDGPQPVTTVDGTAIDRAGEPGPWRFLRSALPEGRLLVSYDESSSAIRFFTVAGGAPIMKPDGDWHFGVLEFVSVILKQAIDEPSAPSPPYERLRYRPREGTFLEAAGRAYRVVGGAPIYISSWVPCGGVQPRVTVDPLAIARAGTGGDFNHLAAPPTSPPAPC